jgi:hypothetical protein
MSQTISGAAAAIYVENIGEIVLNIMDALSSSVRNHLNLGAILGSSFELSALGYVDQDDVAGYCAGYRSGFLVAKVSQ